MGRTVSNVLMATHFSGKSWMTQPVRFFDLQCFEINLKPDFHGNRIRNKACIINFAWGKKIIIINKFYSHPSKRIVRCLNFSFKIKDIITFHYVFYNYLSIHLNTIEAFLSFSVASKQTRWCSYISKHLFFLFGKSLQQWTSLTTGTLENEFWSV